MPLHPSAHPEIQMIQGRRANANADFSGSGFWTGTIHHFEDVRPAVSGNPDSFHRVQLLAGPGDGDGGGL